MPKETHVRGVGKQEQRRYEEIKRSSRGRYGTRLEEVVARTVLKHHQERGHRKGR